MHAIEAELVALRDPIKARILSGFFKTGKGEYGEGDVFLGVPVPVQRSIAKRHASCDMDGCAYLLVSPLHECRLVALFILVSKYDKADAKEAERIVAFYLTHKERVNNWDLVDSSAYKVIGAHLLRHPDDELLVRLAGSASVWDRRIAMVATLAHIRAYRFDLPLRIATLLVHDEHDLIRKAVGWMLREMGKRDEGVLRSFLDRHAYDMPRTMLRYAIERFDEKSRRAYMDAD